jgi:predicted RNA-binding Zn ribbon-like protein
VDTSRSGERRWCSMAGCGNKAKVAEFRQRQRKD